MWGDAEQVCEEWGGYLASVSSAFENAHVASYAKTVLKTSVYWLGGSTYLAQDNPYYNWTWTDGANMTYNRWARNQLCVIYDDCCLIQNSTDQYCYNLVPPSTTPWPGNCPDGWAYFNKTQKCYAPVTEDGGTLLADFNYTRNWCINNFGADLVSIHSQEENQWLVEFLNKQDIGASWIGLYNPRVTGKWEWTDGTPVDFTSWGDSEPAPNTYCTFLIMNDYPEDNEYKYKWYAQDLDELTAGVCELPAKGNTQPTRKPTTPPFSNKCDLTWEYYDLTKKCYKNMVFDETFDQCRASCQQVEADLPTIHSVEENELLINFIVLSADNEVGLNTWIGLYSPNLDGNFKWIDGSPLNFTSWAAGEPQTLTYSALLNTQGSARGKWTTLASDYLVGCLCAKNSY
uniref:C-type lectin domain-containing protein n=1 Tax=Acrobeloides nanus TaxID=290746 RepID=A0A914E7P1_9BILA